MSHISFIRVKIRNPNIELVKKVIEEIAKETGGQVVYEIHDYYGARMSVMVGLKNQTFFRGVGVRISPSGELELVGDFYGISDKAIDELMSKIQRYYTAGAMAMALSQLGYNVQSQKVQEKIYIRAVAM